MYAVIMREKLEYTQLRLVVSILIYKNAYIGTKITFRLTFIFIFYVIQT